MSSWPPITTSVRVRLVGNSSCQRGRGTSGTGPTPYLATGSLAPSAMPQDGVREACGLHPAPASLRTLRIQSARLGLFAGSGSSCPLAISSQSFGRGRRSPYPVAARGMSEPISRYLLGGILENKATCYVGRALSRTASRTYGSYVRPSATRRRAPCASAPCIFRSSISDECAIPPSRRRTRRIDVHWAPANNATYSAAVQ